MFSIDKMSRTPIYEQLISQLESRILSGDISPDGQLPSIRFLSQSLSINPNTLQRAYTEMERRGLCYSVPGSGRFLSSDAVEKLNSQALQQTNELRSVMSSLKNKGITKEMVLAVVENVYGRQDINERMVTPE